MSISTTTHSSVSAIYKIRRPWSFTSVTARRTDDDNGRYGRARDIIIHFLCHRHLLLRLSHCCIVGQSTYYAVISTSLGHWVVPASCISQLNGFVYVHICIYVHTVCMVCYLDHAIIFIAISMRYTLLYNWSTRLEMMLDFDTWSCCTSEHARPFPSLPPIKTSRPDTTNDDGLVWTMSFPRL